MLPLVSIIVPIYDVKPYLRKCVDSLLGQSLREIEIILVDDGSTDGCGAICDEYAKRDPRVKVIHQSNQGLSVARNVGIAAASCKYLMFVDGDDFVASDFCRKPYEVAVDNDADIVLFRSYLVKKNHIITRRGSRSAFGRLSFEIAIEKGGFVTWNKLYRIDLFNDIQYPEGRVFEDIATTHKLIHKAHTIIRIKDCLYYHVHHKGSISNYPSQQSRRDGFISAIERRNDLIGYGYTCEDDYTELIPASIGLLSTSDQKDNLFYQRAEQVLDSVNRTPRNLSGKQKLMLLSWKIDKRLFHFICRIIGRK